MPVPKIKLTVLGQPPPGFDVRELLKWKSKVFEIQPAIETYQLNEDAKGSNWEYTDEQLRVQLKRDPSCDIQLIFVSVKLERNWYTRRLDDNRVLFTLYELDQILRFYNFPPRNLALRVLYVVTLIYKRYGDRIPLASEATSFAHDETRGCIFDMNASKIDVIHSLHQPKLCEYCTSQLKGARVSNETIDIISRELRSIRKPLIERISDFVRTHTVWSIVISVLAAILVGTLASLLASIIYNSVSAAT